MSRLQKIIAALIFSLIGNRALAQTSSLAISTIPYSVALQVCFGKDSICSVSNDLYYNCDSKINAQASDAYYHCICETGYLSVQQACDDCQDALGLAVIRNGDWLSSQCKSKSLTIAPIPASVLSLEAARNATMTYLRTTGATDMPTLTTPRASTSPTGALGPAWNPEPDSTFIISLNGFPSVTPPPTATTPAFATSPFLGGTVTGAATRLYSHMNHRTFAAAVAMILLLRGVRLG